MSEEAKLYLNEATFKKLLARKGIPAIRMARDLGWSHTKLNWFAKGYYFPSPSDRLKITSYLQAAEVPDLFVTKVPILDRAGCTK